jgi:hypothetical protein
MVALIELGEHVGTDSLAEAAGTLPFRVPEADAELRFTEALERLGDSCLALPDRDCTTYGGGVRVPTVVGGAELDLTRTSLGISTPSGMEYFPHLSNAAQCDTSENGGFYLNRDDPSRIDLCPCSCARATWGSLRAAFFCK